MRSLGWVLAACAAGCAGEGASPAYYSGGGAFVEDFGDPGVDAVEAEVASLPWKEKVWQHQLNNRPIARMTLGGSHLYVETPDFHLISVNRFNGHVEWIYKVDTETPLDWPPVEADQAPEEIRRREADLFAINRQIDDMLKEKGIGVETQKLQKKRAEIREQLKAAAFGDNVYFVSRQVLYCLDRLSGNLRWTKRLAFVPSAQPFAIRTHVFMPGADLSRVWALDVTNKGDRAATFNASIDRRENHIMNRPVFSDPSLFFTCHDGKVYCYNVPKGQLNWTYETERELRADPVIFEHKEAGGKDDKGKERPPQSYRMLFVGGMDFCFYALDGDSGALLWKYECGAEVKTPAIAKDRTVYFKTEDGALHAMDILPMHRDPKTGAAAGLKRNGQLRWKLPLAERFLSKGRDRVYVMGPKKEIFGVNEMTGETMGRYPTDVLQHVMSNTGDNLVYVANSAGYLFCLRESRKDF